MAKKKRYSYIRHPFSRTGWVSFVLGLIGLLATIVIIVHSVKNDGAVSMFAAAVGLSAVLESLVGLVFCGLSFAEKDRNHAFSAAGGILSFITAIVWIYIFVRYR